MKRTALAILFLSTPTLAFAASPHTFRDLANLVVTILNSATGVLIVLGIAVYFYGVSTNILEFGQGEQAKLRNYFVWGIIVLFVMVSIWGILRLLQNTLFINDRFTPSTGTPAGPGFNAPVYAE